MKNSIFAIDLVGSLGQQLSRRFFTQDILFSSRVSDLVSGIGLTEAELYICTCWLSSMNRKAVFIPVSALMVVVLHNCIFSDIFPRSFGQLVGEQGQP